MNLEQYEKWQPIDGIRDPISRAIINEEHKGLKIILVFSEMIGGNENDLYINFGRVNAYAVHEEFVHPWNKLQVDLPQIGGKWKNYTFPLLIVRNSVWLNSFSDSQIPDAVNTINYRLVTLDQTVDIISNKSPELKWIKPQL